jgi:adenosine deaminase
MGLGDIALTDELLRGIPKAELHIHIEGSLEPEMMFEMAARNGVRLRYGTVRDIRAAYDFSDLQSFLDLYYRGTQVLLYERDFCELTWAYLRKASSQGVRHAEIFFDPQAHTDRGVLRNGLGCSRDEFPATAENSFKASFLSEDEKKGLLEELGVYFEIQVRRDLLLALSRKRFIASAPRSGLPNHARSCGAAPRGRAGSPSPGRCGGRSSARRSSTR